MPASSSSSTSCQRFGWREPATLECASSSTRISAGLARQRGVEVEFGAAACRGTSIRAGGSTGRPSSSAAVSLRPCVSTTPTTHVHALGLQLARGRQHGVGLADAGRRAEVDAQLAAALARLVARGSAPAARRGRGVGRRSSAWRHCHSRPACSSRLNGALASSARLSCSTLTRGSPRKPSRRPSVCRSISCCTCASGSLRPGPRAPPGTPRRPG